MEQLLCRERPKSMEAETDKVKCSLHHRHYRHYNILSATVAKTRSFSAYKQWMHNVAVKTKEVEITETDLNQAFDQHQSNTKL